MTNKEGTNKEDLRGSQPVRRIEARVTQNLHCTPEQLYDAWLDPQQIRQWMSSALQSIGLPGEIKRIETDPRIGGKFCFSDLRKDTQAFHVGRYLDLVRPRRIAFTWSAGTSIGEAEQETNPSQVALTIEPAQCGCVATMVHEMDPQWSEYVSRTEDSWRRMLKAIETLARAQGDSAYGGSAQGGGASSSDSNSSTIDSKVSKA